ncbi:uncharacterized protein LOC130111505 [Lampris incognitus]|uniref:uncharacterized protein LOC130111505 n=1 Tax=Lampris incognitus TaxID=2546036 RepID=UPI0024B4AE73|nr:uncharacterized protein LOC130111505 [Lampris incognitus]XP_056134701.1 uncharacterized protein LOC130111505 [Lampris incognitus]
MTDDHTYAATLSSPDTNNNSTIRHGGWICSGQANIEYPQLKVWLPNQYRYHACHFEVVPSLGDHTAFDATVRVDVGTVEQAQEWLIKLKESSGVTWRVDVTRPRLGRRVLLKASYKCQRRVNVKAANSRTSTKNTCCPAKIHILLKCASGQMSKTKDPHMPDFPFEVRIVNRHNHNLYVADALRHRDVGEKAKEILTGLFEIGHSPTSALAVLKHDLQMEYGERFLYASANREICPDLPYV